MKMQMRVCFFAVLPVIVGVAGCSAVAGRGVAGGEGTPVVRSPVVLLDVRGATPDFTVQGVLHDAGGPVTDTIPVIATIEEVGSGSTLWTSPILALVAQDGLFRVDVPLPDAAGLAAAGDLQVVFEDAGTMTPIGGPLAMTFSPRAWAAEYAKTAGVAAAIEGDETVDLAPEPGWSNYGSGYSPIRATRVGKMIHLSGLVAGSNYSAIATLPPGFRPSERNMCAGMSQNNLVRIDVFTDGRIYFTTGTSVGFISLNGISFPAAD